MGIESGLLNTQSYLNLSIVKSVISIIFYVRKHLRFAKGKGCLNLNKGARVEEKPKPQLKLHIGGEEREISFEELTLVNNAALEALLRLFVRKKIIKPEEFLEELKVVETERYRFQKNEPAQ